MTRLPSISGVKQPISTDSENLVNLRPAWRPDINGGLRTIYALARGLRSPLNQASANPSSLLDAVGTSPQRLKFASDALTYLKDGVVHCSKAVYGRFFTLGGSIFDTFGINALIDRLKNADAKSVVETVSPFLLAGFAEYLNRSMMLEQKDQKPQTREDLVKLAIGCIILGYSMTHRITEQSGVKNVAARAMQKAAAIWSFVNLHRIAYNAGSASSDMVGSWLTDHDIIVDSTRTDLNLLFGCINTFAVYPMLLLKMAEMINKRMASSDVQAGRGTQSSKISTITNGLIPEVNTTLQIYDHFTKQLSNPGRLFQYFIVVLNVLKEIVIPDPSKPADLTAANKSNFAKKTRNVWLLAAESFLKAKTDLTNRLGDIAKDTANNLQEYTVIRNGITLQHVCRYQLELGDLIRIEEATSTVCDLTDGSTRTKAALSGYLVQLDGQPTSKKVAISLAELNGESKPVLLDPPRKEKSKAECVPIDLFTVPTTAAIFPGTEFLSFDNGNPDASPAGLYLQIAAVPEVKQATNEKIPFSAQQISNLKTTLIKGVLAVSGIGALLLMRRLQAESNLGLLMSYYGAEFIDKFTQVFVEAQTLIPLTSDVVLEVTNNELLRNLNSKLEDKITLNNALCIADLFEALHKKNVRIYSDKTGTVTETFMHLRDIVCPPTPAAADRVLTAFVTTYSDQKTEAEENEIRHYYQTKKGIKIDSKPVPGQETHLEKTITKEDQPPVHMITKRVGLFTDFGGQFTIREQKGAHPVLVFCGAPKAEDNGEEKFRGTNLLKAYQEYEHQQQHADQSVRQDSLTRDWCIAEAKLSSKTHTALLAAMENKNPDESKRLIKEILRHIRGDFEYLGTFQIDNPIKPGARETIHDWNKSGTGFMMITGDTKNAARMIALKLFPNNREHVYTLDELLAVPNWETQDLGRSTVIMSDTKPTTLALLDKLETLGDRKPNIIFCQMKDNDKKNLVVHAKAQGKFIIANGDGCNDLLMLKEAHVAIGDSARDGSFARGVQDASTFTDVQLRQLMKGPNSSLYQLLDLHKGKNSKFLKHFAPLANTQPKVITSLLGKALKSVAIPRALGMFTREIPGQFVKLLAYDAAFLGATYQANIATADTPFVDGPIDKSILPYVTLFSAVGIGALQSAYCYTQENQQVTTMPILLGNLAASVGCLYLFLAPPGYAPKTDTSSVKIEEIEDDADAKQIVKQR